MTSRVPPPDELGAHVSAAQGVEHAPGRASAIGARVFQLFTKQPNRWSEPVLDAAVAGAFREARDREKISTCGAHDSYLINLATPDPVLARRSRASFVAELRRCAALDLDFVVTHPGHATDGDLQSGISRNAEAIGLALEEVPTRTKVLLELTAGAGSSVGGHFDALRVILDRLPPEWAHRVGVCFDTCHAYAAGYDLVGDYDGVWGEFGDVLGFERLGLLHLNDSLHPLGSHRDRHAAIAHGTLGEEPFRRIMNDERLAEVPKVLETPKGKDAVEADRANLARLRSYRGV